MAGIYIHIPFCKKACHYCDFHFSTSLRHRQPLLEALHKELFLRRFEVGSEPVETIYFGGGTPSLLRADEISALLKTIGAHYNIAAGPEITLEANPDDLLPEYLHNLAHIGINRLSIGVQSFFEDELRWMNRAHSAVQSETSLRAATALFDNISIDLIYGIPISNDARWRQNLEKALEFGVNHISSYALTVEPKTALDKMILKGQTKAPDDSTAQSQFEWLCERLSGEGFVQYEISNFGKPGYFSRNNTAYWLGKSYLGIGPSAHSYDGLRRKWNISNNILYTNAIQQRKLPLEVETLSARDRYNEYAMTGLRTIWGIELGRIDTEFGPQWREHLLNAAQKHLDSGHLEIKNDTLFCTPKGKFLADGIASDLFIVDFD